MSDAVRAKRRARRRDRENAYMFARIAVSRYNYFSTRAARATGARSTTRRSCDLRILSELRFMRDRERVTARRSSLELDVT